MSKLNLLSRNVSIMEKIFIYFYFSYSLNKSNNQEWWNATKCELSKIDKEMFYLQI